MKNKKLINIVLSAMFICIGLVLPLLDGQIPQINKILSPMHIPVILCGFICGWKYGLATGFILPLLRSVTFSKPEFFPTAVIMSFELAAYGFFAGFIYSKFKNKSVIKLYISLVSAMLLGRLVKGVVQAIVLSFTPNGFVFSAYIAGAYVDAVPGIVIQLIIIPAVIIALEKTKMISIMSKE